jgi:hypothetical protein
MLRHHTWIRVVALGFLPAAAVVLVLLAGGGRPARAYVDAQLPTLTDIVRSRPESGLGDKRAFEIAVLRVEKINREKKAITYRKLRDLKGTFPGQHKQFEGTFTHVLRPMHNSPNFRAWDVANQERLNEQVLTCAAEGKKAVVFQRLGAQLICVGQAWYSFNVNPLGQQHLPQAGASDARYARVFCGDVEELIAAVTDLLARKEVTVPRMVGNDRMLTDRTAPIRRGRADRYDEIDAGHFGRPSYYMSPFRDQAPWSTHRGNGQRTGADDGPGPKGPRVLWVHKSENQFIAPLVPGAKDLYASSKAPFFAGPAVANNTVYAADLQGVVHALTLADGKREWTLGLAADPATKASGMVYGSPMVHGGRLYLATCNPGDTRAQAAGVVVCIGDKIEQDAGKP